MTSIVWRAFFHSTGLKAGTPSATASVPVMAEQPSAKARASSRMPTCSTLMPVAGATLATLPRVPSNDWQMPSPIISSIRPMKT
jgi:hypothetical protein